MHEQNDDRSVQQKKGEKDEKTYHRTFDWVRVGMGTSRDPVWSDFFRDYFLEMIRDYLEMLIRRNLKSTPNQNSTK